MKKPYRHLPETPGVYLMKGAKGHLLYIGKAGNLKRRVSSYFQKAHGSRIERLVSEIRSVEYRKTDSALEALILESALIKKHQPPWNIREKDDKSFLYVEITRERFPRVLLVRGKELAAESRGTLFGPFTSASNLKEALRIIRRIFPYNLHPPEELKRLTALPAEAKRRRACFNFEIGMCPGVCTGTLSAREYAKTVRYIKDFFRGRKQAVLRSLEREMAAAAKRLEFERAAKIRGQVFALRHIRDTALVNRDEFGDVGATRLSSPVARRIEGYDISNISGTSAVGSMVVFTSTGLASGLAPDKDEYRKFRLRWVVPPKPTRHTAKAVGGQNTPHPASLAGGDTGMLREIIARRLGNDWPLPDLMLVDGGRGQVNVVLKVLAENGVKIPVVGIAKGPTRKKNEFVGPLPTWTDERTLIRVRDEAHRFAISYHRTLRGRESFNKKA
ncbi:MAG: GIY-YIG nuclease family protein [Patescibacteria group bacterium]